MRRLLVIFVLGSVALAGCLKKNPAYCDTNDQCLDPQHPFCDLEGAYGLKHACVAAPGGDASVGDALASSDACAACNDNNACTDDSCDGNGGCTHTAVVCHAPNACVTAGGCDPHSGCTWTAIPPMTVDSEGAVGKFASLKVNSAGHLYVSYFDETNKRLKLATNESGQWTKRVLDTGTGSTGVGQFTSLTIDGHDKVYVSYYDADHGSLKVATNSLSSDWPTATVDGAPWSGAYSSIGVASNGTIYVSYYYTYTTPAQADAGVVLHGNLKVATNVNGQWTSRVVDSSAPITGKDTSLVIDKDSNKVYVSYLDWDNASLRLATYDSSSWTTELVEQGTRTDYVGRFSSLGIDGSGGLLIAHYNWAGGNDLKFSSKTSGSWSNQPLESTGDVGKGPSLAIGKNGTIYISYVDATNHYLDLITRSTGNWVNKVVDGSGNVGPYDPGDRNLYPDGPYTSMALDANDTAYIAYYDSTNKDLKVAMACR